MRYLFLTPVMVGLAGLAACQKAAPSADATTQQLLATVRSEFYPGSLVACLDFATSSMQQTFDEAISACRVNVASKACLDRVVNGYGRSWNEAVTTCKWGTTTRCMDYVLQGSKQRFEEVAGACSNQVSHTCIDSLKKATGVTWETAVDECKPVIPIEDCYAKLTHSFNVSWLDAKFICKGGQIDPDCMDLAVHRLGRPVGEAVDVCKGPLAKVCIETLMSEFSMPWKSVKALCANGTDIGCVKIGRARKGIAIEQVALSCRVQ